MIILKNEKAVERRAHEIVKTMRACCSCGGDSRYPGWHHEGCATEAAWDAAYDQAANEVGEYERVTEPVRGGK